MTVTLNHTVVTARDNAEAARTFAAIMGLDFTGYDGLGDRFSQVRVNVTLSLDFVTTAESTGQHLAFDVDGATFDRVIRELSARNILFGNDPAETDNGRVGHPLAARGLYWTSSDGHLFEIMTDVPSGTPDR